MAMSETTAAPSRLRSDGGTAGLTEPARAAIDGRVSTDGPGPAEAVRIVAWRDGAVREWSGIEGLAEAYADPSTRLWIDLVHPPAELIGRIAEILGFHPLLAEDIAERNQRAKAEIVESVLHLVLFSLAYDGDQIYDRELDFVLGPRLLLSGHSTRWDPRATHHLRSGPGALLGAGPDRLLWALADDIVDEYFPVLDRLGDEIDDLQDTVVAKANPETLERLFDLKRELVLVRRVTAPEREIFNLLTNREMGLVQPDQVLYFRDVYDHLIRLTDELDNYRELVSGTLDVYLSTVNNNLSLIMKRLTGVTVIVAGIGAIGGLFGMSEAGAAFSGAEAAGFWVVVFGTIAISLAAALILRRLDWI